MNNFKPGDTVKLINTEVVHSEHHTNWLQQERIELAIGDEFVVISSIIQFGDEWIELDKLIYAHPASKFELVKEEESYANYLTEGSVEALNIIADKDHEFYLELENLIKYLASTFSDKYADADISTKGILMSKHLGKGFNIGNAGKYIARYATTGYSKSENIQDLYKVAHYCLFELQRRTKNGESGNN